MEGRIDPPSSAHRLTVAAMAGQAGSGMVWLIEDNGQPIACAFGTLSGDVLYLGKIAVAGGFPGGWWKRRRKRPAPMGSPGSNCNPGSN